MILEKQVDADDDTEILDWNHVRNTKGVYEYVGETTNYVVISFGYREVFGYSRVNGELYTLDLKECEFDKFICTGERVEIRVR